MRKVFLLALLSAGCVVGVDEGVEGDIGEEGPDDETSSRIALNGLTAFGADMSLTLDHSLLPTLAKGSLKTAAARVPQLFATAAGRDKFAYIYSCAERRNQSLTVTVSGTSYTFRGSMELAREWTSTALTPSKYELMSACMLARTNYFGVEVAISMRSHQLGTKPSEKAAYTVVEGAFWGDVFTEGGSMRACASPAKLSGEAISTLPQRECTASVDGVTTKCGFSYAGECTDVCATGRAEDLAYTNCDGNAGTIAVYVAKP